MDGGVFIEQKTIPAVEGNIGFSTKEDAELVAKIVIEKMKQGEIPPSITVEDLKQSGIVNE